MISMRIVRAGPLVTLQDSGRPGMLKHGISASGPMDAAAFRLAGAMLRRAGATALEFTAAGLTIIVDGPLTAAGAGGQFTLAVNGDARAWPARLELDAGDSVEITPGPAGNYGYLRFGRQMSVPPIVGSRATNLAVGLGGYKGRALRPGDRIEFGDEGDPIQQEQASLADGPIRIMWGLHADLFDPALRQRFLESAFLVSPTLDRMGVRLADPAGVFRGQRKLGLVSDAIVAGDVQILGDGTPVVLMRDHQPTGGYPRIATLVSADLDRFAQMRPGTELRFKSVTLEHAR